MKEFKTIQVSQTDRFGKILLAHQPLNIIGFEMMAELSNAIDEVASSPVLILSTALQHFSTGVDIKIHTPDKVPEMLSSFHQVIRKLYHFPGITVGFIRGYALGGGMELALCCDLILADQTAHIGFPEIQIAAYPPVATVLLPRLIGRAANCLLMTGEAITAKRAHEIGIIDSLDEDESTLTARFQELSPDALKSLKLALRKSSDFNFDEALSVAENIYKEELLNSPDVVKGVQNFLNRKNVR